MNGRGREHKGTIPRKGRPRIVIIRERQYGGGLLVVGHGVGLAPLRGHEFLGGESKGVVFERRTRLGLPVGQYDLPLTEGRGDVVVGDGKHGAVVRAHDHATAFPFALHRGRRNLDVGRGRRPHRGGQGRGG